MTRDELIGVLQDACGPDDEVVLAVAGSMMGMRIASVTVRYRMDASGMVAQLVPANPLAPPRGEAPMVPLVAE